MNRARGKANPPRDAQLDDELDEELEEEESGDSEDSNTDNIGEASVEINVDELIAEMESEGLSTEHLSDSCARRRLEEIMEQKRIARELGDFDDFDFD